MELVLFYSVELVLSCSNLPVVAEETLSDSLSTVSLDTCSSLASWELTADPISSVELVLFSSVELVLSYSNFSVVAEETLSGSLSRVSLDTCSSLDS